MRTTWHALWMAPALLALVQAAPAEMVTLRVGTPPEGALAGRRTVSRPRPPVAYVARAPAAPVIDGALDEPPWKQATRLTLARTLDGTGATCPRDCLDGAGALLGGARSTRHKWLTRTIPPGKISIS